MTPKQILDSFSETLMRDERILSAKERAFLATLLHHAKVAPVESQATREAVRAVFSSAIGETVAQRAFSVLGASIVEKILQNGEPLEETLAGRRAEIHATSPKEPQTPSGPRRLPEEPETPSHAPQPPSGPRRMPFEPEPPSISPSEPQTPSHMASPPQTPEPEPPSHTPGEPQPPGGPRRMPFEPEPPSISPSEPQTPSKGIRQPQPLSSVQAKAETGAAVMERPQVLAARCIVLDEFFAPQELQQLMQFTLDHEADFTASEVLSPHSENGIVNYEHRRSRVLMDLAQHQDVIVERVKSVLPEVLRKLGMASFTIAGVEAQITASNDGDFFRFHSDNGSDRVSSRYLTFVYFFHREPRPFEGGELRIHDVRLNDEDGLYLSEGSYQTIVPRQNQIVFFPCEMRHEITPVKCPSRSFADSRFTLNGWLRR